MSGVVRTEFSTTSADEACDLVAKAYSDNRLRIYGGPENFRFEMVRYDLGGVAFDRVCSTLHTEFTVEPPAYVAIDRVLAGELAVRTDGVERRFGRGEPLLVARPERDYTARAGDVDLATVTVQLALLEQLTDSRLTRLSLDTITPQRARLWQHTVDFVTGTLLSDDAAAAGPLVLGAAERLVAAALLTAFGSEQDDAPADRVDAMPATVRRAVAFVDSGPDLDIGVAEIARAANVSVRSLQLAFRRHLDTTPLAYLRRVRLERTRAELIDGDPASTSVGAISARWGFLSASRFSTEYKSAYGESPSVTLRR